MKKDAEKTNVMRILEQHGLPHKCHYYESDGAISGPEVAKLLGEDPDHVFKTLVTVGKSGGHYVFVLPVCCELELKKAASAVKEKSIDMLKSKELLPLTGYIHGGCSPIGMKEQFKTVVDESALLFDTIIFSAGRIGAQVELPLESLSQVIPVELADICV